MPAFPKTTALYGGSFDPIHLGHLHVANEVLRLMPNIQQFVFVPAHRSPGKPKLSASPEERLQFIKIATEGTALQVWDFEALKAGESFTIDTVEEAHRLGATRERLFWVMGADAYLGFESWRNKDRIRALCRLVVVERPGVEIRAQNPEDILLKIDLHPMSATPIRESLSQGKIPEKALPPPLERHFKNLLLNGKNPYAMH